MNCAWCFDKSFDSITGKKCDLYEQLVKDGCPSPLIYNPVNTIEVIDELGDTDYEELENKPETSSLESNKLATKDTKNANSDKVLRRSNKSPKKRNADDLDDKLVQLKPDKIRLQIRPHTKVRFNLTFEQAKKYPLDIYYLMDLTYSMKDHRK